MLFFTVFRPIKLRKTRYKPFESCIVHQFYFPQKVFLFGDFPFFGLFSFKKVAQQSSAFQIFDGFSNSFSIYSKNPLFL